MYSFKSYFVILLVSLLNVEASISDKRLCADPKCSVPIAEGKTLINYPSPEEHILSFPTNAKTLIYSKSAGSNKDLWGVEISGKRGYVPKIHIQETKVLMKNLKYTVDTELGESVTPKVPSIQSGFTEKNEILPNTVQQPYEIVDGTPIYLTPEEIAETQQVKGSFSSNILNNNQFVPIEKEGELKQIKTIDSASKINSEENIDGIMKSESKLDINSDELKKNENRASLGGDKSIKIEENENKDVSETSKENVLSNKGYLDISESNDKKEIISEKKEESILNNIVSWLSDGSKVEENVDETREEVNSEDSDEEDEEYEDDDDDGDDDEDNEDDDDDEKIVENKAKISDQNLLQNDELKSVKSEEKIETNLNESQISLTNEEQKENINAEKYNEKEKNNEHNTNYLNEIEEKMDGNVNADKSNEEIKKEGSHLNRDTPVKNNQVNDNVLEKIDENILQEANRSNSDEPNLLDDAKLNVLNFESGIDENLRLSVNTPNNIKESVKNLNSEPKIFNSELKDNVATKNLENQISDVTVNDITNILEKKDESSTKLPISTTLYNSKEPLNTLNSEPKISNSEYKDNFATIINPESRTSDVTKNDITNVAEKEVEIKPEISSNSDTSKSDLILEDTETVNLNISEKIEKTENVQDKNELKSKENDEKVENLNVEIDNFTNLVSNTPENTNTEVTNERSGPFSNIYSTTFGNKKSEDINEKKLDSNVEEIVSVSKSSQEKSSYSENIIQQDKLSENDDTYDEKFNDVLLSKLKKDEQSCELHPFSSKCDSLKKPNGYEEITSEQFSDSLENSFSEMYSLLIALLTAGISIVMFLWGYIILSKRKKECLLVAKINELEKQLLLTVKENEFFKEKLNDCTVGEDVVSISNNEIVSLRTELEEALNMKSILEEQVQTLEKELENSTEVGLELNRMLSDVISSQNGSETLLSNIEQMQRQLLEQQTTINTVNEMLSVKDTENHELQLELEICNKKVVDLQSELDKMVLNLLKIEEEKLNTQNKLESELISYKEQIDKLNNTYKNEKSKLLDEINVLKNKYCDVQRKLDLKINEYNLLKGGMEEFKNLKNNNEVVKSLLDVTSLKAELQQFQRDNKLLAEHLQEEELNKHQLQRQLENISQEMQILKTKYDETDSAKLEAQTKLEVLSNYFTEREAQLQKEIAKKEALWTEKQGEATSTVERIKYMQDELQNYKSQNESLKQEIVSQEVQLKSQISVLEKKAHENWVLARQAERKLDDAKQEAAQLRNRLTMRERTLLEDKGQNRLVTPPDQNGDLPISPINMPPIESPASPPLLYGARDLLTTSPPLPGLPPFLPPPPGVPFMPPPPHGVPHFMPPPPTMFPGDHRPPPLGRMSSPPLNSRYSPDSRAFSPYDRNSPSPTYDEESEYSPSSRGFNSFARDDRRDFRRLPPSRNNVRNAKGSNLSSGSGNSNDSIEKINRHHSKV